MRSALVVLLMVWASAAQGQSEEVPGSRVGQVVAMGDVVFVTAGPMMYHQEYPAGEPQPAPGVDWCAADRYRIGFEISEIYYSLVVDRHALRGPECNDSRWAGTHRFTGFEIASAAQIESGRLTNLEFVRWEAWNRAVLSESGIEFTVEFSEDGSLVVTH